MIRHGKICLSLLYNYLLTPSKSKESDGYNTLSSKSNKLKSISNILQNYGGVLAKLSQILCIDDQDNSSFSECKPYAQKETIENFKKMYKENKDGIFKNVKDIDFDVLKAGSVGQVHRAKYDIDDKEKDIIMKVQYFGIVEQMKSDIQVLDLIVNFLYSLDFTDAVNSIKTKLFEELDYTIESSNQEYIKEIWKDDERIIIPSIIHELSSDKILAMDFINGLSYSDFIKNSSQEERNKVGFLMVDFTFTNIFKHNIFYSDVHYGNYLICKENNGDIKLCVLDFGCIHKVSDELVNNIKKLHVNIYKNDKKEFINTVIDIGIITEDSKIEAKDYIYEYFKIQYEPWMNKDFEFTKENLTKINHKNVELMKDWNLPTDLVYFNKIPFGLFFMLEKINFKYDLTGFFEELVGIKI
jgi:predicted unusual protein kinase regulating ubiquinone biosynthesis (AarF/ABC1/UbiB family)